MLQFLCLAVLGRSVYPLLLSFDDFRDCFKYSFGAGLFHYLDMYLLQLFGYVGTESAFLLLDGKVHLGPQRGGEPG